MKNNMKEKKSMASRIAVIAIAAVLLLGFIILPLLG